MKQAILFLLALALFATGFSQSSKQQYKVAVVGFYNLENFFDTVNNPIIDDEEFLPGGA